MGVYSKHIEQLLTIYGVDDDFELRFRCFLLTLYIHIYMNKCTLLRKETYKNSINAPSSRRPLKYKRFDKRTRRLIEALWYSAFDLVVNALPWETFGP